MQQGDQQAKSMKAFVFLVLILVMASVCLAQDSANGTVVVAVDIPQQQSLSISIAKVEGNVWTKVNGLEFGDLVYDEVNQIFTSRSYFAVDLQIIANTPTWSIIHTCTSVTNGTTNLDKNLNVVFVNQKTADSAEEIEKVSYSTSNGKSLSKSKFSQGGWLRVYYGLATGDIAKDAPGVTPLINSNSAGAYNGNVSFTLTS